MARKFLRSSWRNYSKLGKRRKKKQKYRKAKGRDNKIRLKRKGRLRKVEIGFRSEKRKRGLIKGLKPVIVHNIKDLKSIKKDEIGIIAKIGDKKKKEILEYAIKNYIKLSVDAKKVLEKIEEKKKIKEKKKKEKSTTDKKSSKKKDSEKLDTKKEQEENIKNNETDVKENAEEKK